MPTVRISADSMARLVAKASELEIKVKDLLDSIILYYFTEEETEEEEELEEETEEEESEEEEEE